MQIIHVHVYGSDSSNTEIFRNDKVHTESKNDKVHTEKEIVLTNYRKSDLIL